jgi:hypothetical protein
VALSTNSTVLDSKLSSHIIPHHTLWWLFRQFLLPESGHRSHFILASRPLGWHRARCGCRTARLRGRPLCTATGLEAARLQRFEMEPGWVCLLPRGTRMGRYKSWASLNLLYGVSSARLYHLAIVLLQILADPGTTLEIEPTFDD